MCLQGLVDQNQTLLRYSHPQKDLRMCLKCFLLQYSRSIPTVQLLLFLIIRISVNYAMLCFEAKTRNQVHGQYTSPTIY